MAVILCNDNFCAAVFVVPLQALFTTSCFALFYVFNFVLLYPALNDWPFMKYASNYFSSLCAVSLPACPVLPPPPSR
jgi:hypothetical protein